jgi:hypothetical protein
VFVAEELEPRRLLAGASPVVPAPGGQRAVAPLAAASAGLTPPPGSGIYTTADELFLDDLERRSVLFFYNETNPATGLVPDSANANGGSPSGYSSIAAVGFGLTALTIGATRGWIPDADAYQRALNTVNFLYDNAANVNGFFYHFLNPSTGARSGTSEVSSIDTAELMAGVISVGQYWAGTPLQASATKLFNRVNWPWMQRGDGVFYGAWTPEAGFSGGYGDFSEAVLLYLLAMGSPTHPTSQSSWRAWSRTPVVNYAGMTFVTAGEAALFTVQYPQAWFDLRGLTDATGLAYYQNAQTATLAQRRWMSDLRPLYPDYAPNFWGLTASDGPHGYTVWGGPPAHGPIDGTVVPTAPGGSLQFTPRQAIDTLANMKQTYGSTVYQRYGFVDAFNPLTSWTSSLVLGIDVGMMLISAENSRSNLVWNVFGQSPVAQLAIAKAFPSPAASVWIPTGSGDWNLGGNWANGIVPNGVGAAAVFGGAIAAGRTVFSDAPVTVGTLTFDNESTYVLTGAGTLTLQAVAGAASQVVVRAGTQKINLPTVVATDTVFNVSPGATLVIADVLTIAAGKTLTETGGGTVIYQSTVTRLAAPVAPAVAPANALPIGATPVALPSRWRIVWSLPMPWPRPRPAWESDGSGYNGVGRPGDRDDNVAHALLDRGADDRRKWVRFAHR